MAAFLNVCRFTPSAGGTADWTYAVAVTGYQSPTAAGVVNGRLYKYRAESVDLSQWEVGEGAYNTSSGVLARTTVLFNSAGTNAKINFSTTPDVAIVALKEDLISIEEANGFTATQKARARANIDALKKNYIVNGGMQISQEWGATAGVTANAYHAVDQFYATFSNASGFTFGQVASPTPGGSPNRIRLTVTTADASVGATDYQAIVQKIEGRRSADLLFGTSAAKTITIQFGVKAPAGTYCVAVVNGSSNRSYTAEFIVSAGEANSDRVKSVTIAGDQSGTWATDNTIGLEIRWCLMAGSSVQQTAGSWGAANSLGSPNQVNLMGTNGNVFELFDVGLYEGASAPNFELPDYDDELRRCQRYYLQTGASEYFAIGSIINGALTAAFPSMPVPVAMRANPTITLGTSAAAYIGGNSQALSSVTAVAQLRAALTLSPTWAGAIAGAAIGSAVSLFGGTTPTKFNARM